MSKLPNQQSPRGKNRVLVIMDGLGRDNTTHEHNAVYSADTPCLDALEQGNAATYLMTCGPALGLPEGQMGNSETGHLHLGAGRRIPQDLVRINEAISEGSFACNTTLLSMLEQVKQHGSVLHVIAMCSPGGVHGHSDHVMAWLDVLKAHPVRCLLHLITDGRDAPPRSALVTAQQIQEAVNKLPDVEIGSVCGRFYAMDRDSNYDRTQAFFDLIYSGKGESSTDCVSAIKRHYEHGVFDEFIPPTILPTSVPMSRDDAIFFTNFRADRMRQIAYCFLHRDKVPFAVPEAVEQLYPVAMTPYTSVDIPHIVFEKHTIAETLGEVVSAHQGKQLRIAESEKYAHVTYFFNGGVESPFEHEDRILIPSPGVRTYDLQPGMHAHLLTERLIEAINQGSYDLIIVNYANADMVGHTGDFKATVEAVETVDRCLAEVITAVKDQGGEMLITADHGNAEKMFDHDKQMPHTFHTTLPVPLYYVGPRQITLRDGGSLCDIAPTMLALMGIEAPAAMTGRSLLVE